MAIEVFHGPTIPRDLATARLEFIWAKWRTLQATGALTVHRLVDEASSSLHPYCAYVTPAGDDFALVYIGSALQPMLRGPATTMLSSLGNFPAVRELAETYRRVARDMTPAFTRFTGRRSAPGTIWHQAILPVRISPTSVMVVCCFEEVNHQLEIYEHLFRTAPDAIAVASPITNDAGHVTDGWVLMMNDRARDMLDYRGSITNLRLRGLPQFNGIDLWGRIYAPRSAATMLVTAPNFDIEILRFPHVLGLRLKPKSATGESPTLAPALSDDESALGLG